MGYQIKHTYEVSNTQEISVDWNGCNFLIIYGKHINGWFIAIPNWGICVEAGSPESENYNEERLSGSFSIDDYKIPGIISKSIKEHWEGLHK